MEKLLVEVSWLELFRIKVQEGFSGLKDFGTHSFLLLNSLVLSRSRRVNIPSSRFCYLLKYHLKRLHIYLISIKIAY